MSPEEGWGFAPPPFDASAAALRLRRSLRDLRLTERGDTFELRGRRVVEITAEPAALAVRVARRPTLSPEYDRFDVSSAAAMTRLVAEVGRRLARRWSSSRTA